MRAPAVRWSLALILLASAACSGGSRSSTSTQPSATLESLIVDTAGSLEVGKTAQMSAVGHYSDATVRDLTAQVTWSTSDQALATIAPGGQVTPQSPGTVTIQATYQGVTGSKGFYVLGRSLNVHVAVDSVECIADCDGVALGAGDFDFDIVLDTPDVHEDWTSPSDLVELSDGDFYQVTDFLLDTRQDPEKQFVIRDEPGAFVHLTFRATEWDADILGRSFPDSRMDGRSSTAVYAYAANKNWVPSGANYITIGEGGCVLRMHYHISKS